MRLVSEILKVRLNRRYFWLGLGVIAFATALLAKPFPWVLNGGFVLPWIMLHGARLHDFGRRGLWAWVMVTVVLALLISLAVLRPPNMVYGPAALVALLAFASFTVWVGIKRGYDGPNRFGPSPTGWSLRQVGAK